MTYQEGLIHILKTLPLKNHEMTDADALSNKITGIPGDDLAKMLNELSEKGFVSKGRINTPSVKGDMWFATELGKESLKKK